ncbi:MAG: hypothetical protein IM574_09105 [Cytophagales bacterium]|jgi:hypothetical protein|nr:hypothetical protein [Cytophagales bacterium]MCA6386350.1 hypothetical protein [Cytophagales bacterium]MCA6390479.1 hypothetical protein [Cytophagales bacterium]MCA6395057.1 hypothetical protein [Cytophagales bacterium]MCA6397967.1 hypothetical protein [Cytophagales bacterium]
MKQSALALLLILIVISCSKSVETNNSPKTKSYAELETLFKEWREFQRPPFKDGTPDYSVAAMKKQQEELSKWQQRLNNFDTTGWAINQQIDWYIVKAEMNGLDFDHRVMRPWERDPAFYKTLYIERSDVPAHEGPTHAAIIDVWKYAFPLTSESKDKLVNQLRVIATLNEEAKINLTGNAKDLWIAGIRDIKTQSKDLESILSMPGVSEQSDVVTLVKEAIVSTNDLATWLEKESASKTGPSGIGKENYTWYQQNVHLVPLTWEDEVLLLKRELARAWTGLKLEEHRNRNLPELKAADTPEAFAALTERAAKSLLNFLDKDSIVTVKSYFEPALRANLGKFVPAEKRNFFIIGLHHDPRPLYSHFYHWFELARMDTEPHTSIIRREPLLYNIFDSRNEGTATAVEEMFMQAGLYNDDPRVKEIVYIMIAQRAARGLGSLYAHANELTMEEAGKIHADYTPRGWMKTEKDLLIFEQHLYMRQPGYGSSYITGKYLLEGALAEFARLKESKQQPFHVKDFFDQLNAIGCIPTSLGHWEMTGDKSPLVKAIE